MPHLLLRPSRPSTLVRLPLLGNKAPVLGFAVVLGLGLTACTHTETPSPTTSMSTVAVAPTPSTSEAVKLRSFAEFRSRERLPATLGRDAANASVRFLPSGCTGTMINGYFVSAGHCVDTGTSSKLTISTWQNGMTERGEVVNTAKAPGVDLVVGKVKWTNGEAGGWGIKLAEAAPEPGQQFVVASMPGTSKEPVISNLTFLGVDPATNDHNEWWVFAIDPETAEDVATKVCTPGASGSLVLNNSGYAAVLRGAITIWDKSAADQASEYQHLADRYGVDAQGVKALCYATPLTASRFQAYANALN